MNTRTVAGIPVSDLEFEMPPETVEALRKLGLDDDQIAEAGTIYLASIPAETWLKGLRRQLLEDLNSTLDRAATLAETSDADSRQQSIALSLVAIGRALIHGAELFNRDPDT